MSVAGDERERGEQGEGMGGGTGSPVSIKGAASCERRKLINQQTILIVLLIIVPQMSLNGRPATVWRRDTWRRVATSSRRHASARACARAHVAHQVTFAGAKVVRFEIRVNAGFTKIHFHSVIVAAQFDSFMIKFR